MMTPRDDDESLDGNRDGLVKAILEEMIRDGSYAKLVQERDRRPGSTIKVKVTPEEEIKIYVDDPSGPSVGEILFGLIVFVTIAVIACGALGWLVSKLYQWIEGPQPDIDALFLYRGVLFGCIAGLFAWFQQDDDDVSWSRLSRRKKVISSLIGGAMLIGVLAAGWRLKDLVGTISIFGIFATHYFNSSKSRESAVSREEGSS